LDTVTTTYQSEYKIKNSKFFGYLAPCTSSEELNTTIEKIKNEHPTASHHCYAYRINPSGPREFSTDDGEPGGTAGAPILNQLKSNDFINIVCVVVRYYGGTNLGKSGLISAYSHTASLAIETAQPKKIVPVVSYHAVYGYEHQSVINTIKHMLDFIEIESTYMEKITLTFAVPEEQTTALEKQIASATHLFDEFEKLDRSFRIME
jgi:uncharacterized YigZ family protein